MTLKKILRFFWAWVCYCELFQYSSLSILIFKNTKLHFQALPDMYTKQNKYHSVVLQIRNNP